MQKTDLDYFTVYKKNTVLLYKKYMIENKSTPEQRKFCFSNN